MVSTPSSAQTHRVRKRRTIKQSASFSGIGIHTGKEVELCFRPAKEGSGVYFQRVDLPGKPVIPAALDYVQDTARSTTIGINNTRIHTVEHVLAAVKAFNIDDLCIEISSIEPPVGNGSSDVFVEMIERAGIEERETMVPIFAVTEPIYFSDKEIHLVALPDDGFRISYTLNYPDAPMLRAQYHSLTVNADTFKKEISPCRTFSLYQEVSMLMDRGLIKGGSLDNAVMIKDDAIFSKGGLFFHNEMARHKILDLIGDLALIGVEFHAHVIAIRSGHGSNFAFAKKLHNHIMMEKPIL